MFDKIRSVRVYSLWHTFINIYEKLLTRDFCVIQVLPCIKFGALLLGRNFPQKCHMSWGPFHEIEVEISPPSKWKDTKLALSATVGIGENKTFVIDDFAEYFYQCFRKQNWGAGAHGAPFGVNRLKNAFDRRITPKNAFGRRK